jgi:ABC-type nitrate/sulfonate/bicarbonate transport system ATPase subunit
MNETDVWREDETSDARLISGINGDIEFDAVSVLRNLSLIAREGQTTALVGSSGCGQSLRK